MNIGVDGGSESSTNLCITIREYKPDGNLPEFTALHVRRVSASRKPNMRSKRSSGRLSIPRRVESSALSREDVAVAAPAQLVDGWRQTPWTVFNNTECKVVPECFISDPKPKGSWKLIGNVSVAIIRRHHPAKSYAARSHGRRGPDRKTLYISPSGQEQ